MPTGRSCIGMVVVVVSAALGWGAIILVNWKELWPNIYHNKSKGKGVEHAFMQWKETLWIR
jgi:hypothetical protein